jgi:hypothetical protein
MPSPAKPAPRPQTSWTKPLLAATVRSLWLCQATTSTLAVGRAGARLVGWLSSHSVAGGAARGDAGEGPVAGEERIGHADHGLERCRRR